MKLQTTQIADLSRDFLKNHKVTRYRMKKISEMNDEQVITACHWYCEENNLTKEWKLFNESMESQYSYCEYLQQHIDTGLCYDIQMVVINCIKESAIAEHKVDKEEAKKCCGSCKHKSIV
ncbi:MAG: hypothetical protein J6A95_04885 [Clostridia bacterium]|nr:hypothetical protein [Clostridia bacterium]